MLKKLKLFSLFFFVSPMISYATDYRCPPMEPGQYFSDQSIIRIFNDSSDSNWSVLFYDLTRTEINQYSLLSNPTWHAFYSNRAHLPNLSNKSILLCKANVENGFIVTGTLVPHTNCINHYNGLFTCQ